MEIRKNPTVKVLAFLTAVVAFAAAAVMGCYQLANFDAIWNEDGSVSDGCTVRRLLAQDEDDIRSLISYYRRLSAGEELNTYSAQRMAALERGLSPENTNLRWQLLDRDGGLLWGNTEEALPARSDLYWSSVEAEPDLVLWLEKSLPVADRYQQVCSRLSLWREQRAARLAANAVLAAAGLCLTVFLCAASAHRRGQVELGLNWFHRIPGDLLLAAMAAAAALLTAPALELGARSDWPMNWRMTLVGGYACAVAALGIGLLITFTARCKTRTLLRNTLIWRFCAWCRRLVRSILNSIPLVWKAVLVSLAYLLFSILFAASNEFLWGIATIILLGYLCLWAYQWKRIRQGAREIIGGNVDYQIDTGWMLPDLKAHADELNSLGQSVAAAVEERMRSEHFKAELITNVSHDLKTPLTSIINYVDLLKKEDIDNPRAAEYIEVLDRKSQRLKKLTEDLVEASKASTGVLTVTLERLDLVQLADQALAEYEDRLTRKGLPVVRTLPEEPVWVEADGRHLWRVLDNLLSNCAKYALESTRVYVEVQRYSDCATLSVKNISREELNIPPEQLVERFVRGDESRTQEGSGLGLSIARSLTELQHGRFQVSIDGDLFKATVTLPLAAEPEML